MLKDCPSCQQTTVSTSASLSDQPQKPDGGECKPSWDFQKQTEPRKIFESKMNFPPEVIKNTIVDKERLDFLYSFVVSTKGLPGDIAEVGVYKGGTAYLLREYCDEYKIVYLFDTFSGMPYSRDGVDTHKVGDFRDTSIVDVVNLFKGKVVSINPGIFPRDTGHVIAAENFSLVHLDCDVYDSVFFSLTFFWKRMVPGGIIVFDDYNAPTCPGAKKAVDDFFRNTSFYVLPTVGSQAYVRKP